MIDKSKGIVKCDFCEKEDRLPGSINLHGLPKGWMNIEVTKELTHINCCPVCTRILTMTSYITSRTTTGIFKPDDLKEFFPNLKEKD